MNNDGFIIVGRREDGSTVYYTGRAGQAFVSEAQSEAFVFPSLQLARKRAGNFNKFTPVHGIRFHVPAPQEAVA